MLKKMLEQIGINPERVQLWHISASEGAEFTSRIKEYVDRLKVMGPNPRKQLAIEAQEQLKKSTSSEVI